MRKTMAFFVLLILIASALLAISINDVAPSSDLYPYVVEMVQNNIMQLDSSGNFNGTLVVTRADLARILSRLLNYVQGRVQPLTQVSQEKGSSSATTVAISNELSMKIQKIEDAMKKYSNFEAYIENTSNSLSGIITDVDQMKVQLDSMQRIVASLKSVNSIPPSSLLAQVLNDEKKMNVKLDDLSSKYETLKAENEMNVKKMNSITDSMDSTLTKIEMDFSALNLRMNSLENERKLESQKVSTALDKMSSATKKMESLSQENVELKKQVSSLKATLGQIYLFQALEAAVFIGTIVYVVFMK